MIALQSKQTKLELTILMPCLNEAETLEKCIQDAFLFLETHKVLGEILIADNGSTDGSQQIARNCGARVVEVSERGYGAALIAGSEAALGEYVVMGDADDSYDFTSIMPFMERLRTGDELVMGNRFKGGIQKGAMPYLHKYFGNPVLSLIGRIFFPTKIKDFYCGLRGYNTQAIRELHLRTTGMEYAIEMVVQSILSGLCVSEVPTTLRPDGRSRRPHLRSWPDGWRGLKFLHMYSPNYLFFVPGFLFFFLGLLSTAILLYSPITVGLITFDINTMVYMILLMITGVSVISFGVIAKAYAIQEKFIPYPKKNMLLSYITAERGLLLGFILLICGAASTAIALLVWKRNAFGQLDLSSVLRITLPSLALVVIAIQVMSTSFVVDILRIKKRNLSFPTSEMRGGGGGGGVT